MKKTMIAAIAGIFAGLAITACTAHGAGIDVPEGFYPAGFVVTGVSETTDPTMERVTVESCTGFVYEFYSDAGDWIPGDLVSAIMFDAGTKTIEDDIILDARYSGIAPWFEEVFHKTVLAQFYNNNH